MKPFKYKLHTTIHNCSTIQITYLICKSIIITNNKHMYYYIFDIMHKLYQNNNVFCN